MNAMYFKGWAQPFHMAHPDLYRHSKPGDALPAVPSVWEHELSVTETDEGFVARLGHHMETKPLPTISEAMAAGHAAMIADGWTLDRAEARFSAALACAENFRPGARGARGE